jgi:hypothetical protein
VIEESFTGGMTWSPVRILRGEDEYEEVIVMEPEEWGNALWRFHQQAYIASPDPDAYRLRNTRDGTLIFDGQVPPAP